MNRYKLKSTLKEAHSDGIRALLLRTSTSELISASYDKTVKIWSTIPSSPLTAAAAAAAPTSSPPQPHRTGGGLNSGRSSRRSSLDQIAEEQQHGHHSLTLKRVIHLDSPALSLGDVPGEGLAIGTLDSNVRLWTNAANDHHHHPLLSHVDLINALVIVQHDADTLLVSACYDKRIRLWNVRDNFRLQETLSEHADVVRCLVALPSGDFVSASWDRTIKLWSPHLVPPEAADPATAPTPLAPPAAPTPAKYTFSVKKTLKDTKEHSYSFYALCALAGTELIASGSHDNAVKVWSLGEGKLKRTMYSPEAEQPTKYCAVMALAWCQVAQVLVSGSSDHVVRVWNVESGVCVQALREHCGTVAALVITPSGDIVSGSFDGTIRVWTAH